MLPLGGDCFPEEEERECLEWLVRVPAALYVEGI